MELAEDARRFREGIPILARPVGNWERAWRWCRRNPRVAIPSISAVVLLLAAVVILTWSFVTVSRKNVAIEKEVIRANNAQASAVREAERATKNEGIAKERAAAAKGQAELVTKNMQLFLDEIDLKLSQVPAVTDTRLSILESIVKAWDQIDKSVRDDEEGTAIPTLMVARMKIATVFASLGKLDKADEEYRKLYDIAKHRVKVKQGSDGSRQNLAAMCNTLGEVRQQIYRDMVRSREYFEEALGLLRDIRKYPKPDPKSPPVKIYQVNFLLGNTLQNLGVLDLRSGQLEQADHHFQEALTERERLLQFIQTDPVFAEQDEFNRKAFESGLNVYLDKSSLARSQVLFRLGNTSSAEKVNLAMVQRRKAIAEANPTDMQSQVEYARFCGHAGEFYVLTGRAADGQALLEESVRLLSKAVTDNSQVAANKEYLSFSHYRLGCLWDELNNAEKANEQFQQSRKYREELYRDVKQSEKWQSQLMLALARCGEVDEAKRMADSLNKSLKSDAELLIEQARALAQCVRVSKSDEERKSLIEGAFDALQKALAGGYRDPSKLRCEPDLKPLHDDPRFNALLSTIATQK